MMSGPVAATDRAIAAGQVDLIGRVRARLNDVLRGKAAVIEHVLASLLARGHILLEDLPGLGKTTLARALAVAIGGRFARLQCTPDLLPSDVTGFSVFNQKLREFEFLPGPVFSDVLLADEINRATPRAQSALLEAMAERQVTVDNRQHLLSPQFFVIATQNPIEHQGTYPLPEAQLDRFAIKLSIGYPDRADEVDLLSAAVSGAHESGGAPEAIVPPGALGAMQAAVARLSVAPVLQHYLVDLAQATRAPGRFQQGLSPRAVLMWQRLAQARAFLAQRAFVTPDDIQAVAEPLLSVHLAGREAERSDVAAKVLSLVPVPTQGAHAGSGRPSGSRQ